MRLGSEINFSFGVTEDVVRRAQQGERAAFDELYEAHVGRVYALCLRMSADQALAEELVQDVFVTAWRKIGSFSGLSAFSTWIYRIAANAALDAIKMRRRDPTGGLSSSDEAGFANLAAVEVDLLTQLSVERALASLPDRARMAIVLYAVEGYKYEEVAEMMGVSIGSVKSHIHRARELLLVRLR